MVKKIRVIEEPTVEEVTEEDFRKTIMEIAKSADWKLWELLSFNFKNTVMPQVEEQLSSLCSPLSLFLLLMLW